VLQFSNPHSREKKINGKRYVRASGIMKRIYISKIYSSAVWQKEISREERITGKNKEEGMKNSRFMEWNDDDSYIHDKMCGIKCRRKILADKKYEKCNKFYYYDVSTSLHPACTFSGCRKGKQHVDTKVNRMIIQG
jgi:hypothetical protein